MSVQYHTKPRRMEEEEEEAAAAAVVFEAYPLPSAARPQRGQRSDHDRRNAWQFPALKQWAPYGSKADGRWALLARSRACLVHFAR